MSLASFKYERYGCQALYEETLHSWGDKMRLTRYRLLRGCIGEFFGTMIMMIFGVGVVAQSKFVENYSFFSVCFGWAAGVVFGILVSGKMGYGLFNPAIGLAFAVVGKVPWIALAPAILCQLLGSYIGALTVYGIYRENIRLTYNGQLNMTSALIFFTGPTVGNGPALMDQIVGTALLAAMCMAIVDPHNFPMPEYMHAIFIGSVVTALLGALGVNAGAALNPARDFGPRLALLTVGKLFSLLTYQTLHFSSYCTLADL